MLRLQQILTFETQLSFQNNNKARLNGQYPYI